MRALIEFFKTPAGKLAGLLGGFVVIAIMTSIFFVPHGGSEPQPTASESAPEYVPGQQVNTPSSKSNADSETSDGKGNQNVSGKLSSDDMDELFGKTRSFIFALTERTADQKVSDWQRSVESISTQAGRNAAQNGAVEKMMWGLTVSGKPTPVVSMSGLSVLDDRNYDKGKVSVLAVYTQVLNYPVKDVEPDTYKATKIITFTKSDGEWKVSNFENMFGTEDHPGASA